MKINEQEMLKSDLHLGHKKHRTHPKIKKYIYGVEKGISIFDLYKTKIELEKAIEFASSLKKDKKIMIIVATKKTISSMVSRIAQEHNIFYITNKWIGGFLTNFKSIKKNIDLMNKMAKEKEQGDWNKLVKHEKIEKEKQLNKMMSIYRGVIDLKKIPDALFIVDIKKEKNAVTEAEKLGVSTIAIIDSLSNPEVIDYPIPANDDALESVNYITKAIAEAYSNKK